jgi:hypothetical protein
MMPVLVCVLLQAQAATIELSKNVRVYKGDEGLSVVVASVMPKSENKAVVVVRGADSEIDDVAIVTAVEDVGRGSNLKMTWHGREWSVVTSRESWWGGKQLEVWAPGVGSRAVFYDEAASKKESAKTLEAKVASDKAKVEALARFDRRQEEKAEEDALAKVVDGAAKACGKRVDMRIDWSNISDDMLKKYDISGYCGAALSNLASLCADAKLAAVVKKKVERASCKFGDSLSLTVQGGELAWRTAGEAPNQDAFVSNNLKNLLQ